MLNHPAIHIHPGGAIDPPDGAEIRTTFCFTGGRVVRTVLCHFCRETFVATEGQETLHVCRDDQTPPQAPSPDHQYLRRSA
jgi:hypothetical protein